MRADGQMILTYKYRVKDRSARKALRRHAFGVNQAWNYCVAYQRDIEARYRAGSPKRKWPSGFDLCKLTAGTSKELGTASDSINQVCLSFVQAREARRRSPKFRVSSGPRRSLGWVPFKRTTVRVEGNAITYLGKKYRFWEGGRPVPASTKGGCFVEDARGRWYVCLYIEIADRLATGPQEVGIDLGLKTLATCSDSSTIPALQHYRRYERALGTAQRAGNKRRVRAIHAKIANVRRDQLHKASARIARENSLIVVGNVNAAQLKQTTMAKSISDAGWSMFRNMLRYKSSRHGASYVEADERLTSQLCSDCGVIGGPKGIAQLGMRRWECSACGSVHDRDVNAARNILRVGRSAPPHADGSRGVAQ